MAIAAPTLSSSTQIFKEYNSLFTHGRLGNLSATRIISDVEPLHNAPGIGYPWFLFDPTLDGFQTSKTFYLSSANRQVNGFPETVIPNNIQEAYGKSIPWSNVQIKASAAFINQAFIDNTKQQPFWFYVVPPTGTPIPVVIDYSKKTNENPNLLTPINEWFCSPAGFELSKPGLTFWKTTTGVAIELYSPFSNSVLRHETNCPHVSSLYWIESFLAYTSLVNLPTGQRMLGTTLKPGTFQNTIGSVSSVIAGYQPTSILVPSDIYDIRSLYQVKPHKDSYPTKNYLSQLERALSSCGIYNRTFPTGETAQQVLSAFYSYTPYPQTADIRTMFDILTGNKYKWHYPVTHAGVFRNSANPAFNINTRNKLLQLTPPNRSSLIYGVPTSTFNDKVSGWTAEDVSISRNRYFRFIYKTVINKHLSQWRNLTAIPLTAVEMFNFNPELNTIVVTKHPVALDYKRVAPWTVYHPTLSTWVVYTSAPGLEYFTKNGLLSTTNFITPSSFKNVLLSAIDLDINTPEHIKATNTGTRFGKYEPYAQAFTSVTVKDLTAVGSIPLSALSIGSVSYATDYTAATIHADRVLSGTIFITASGSIPVNQVRGFNSQYKNKQNARIVIPPTRFAVRTPIVLMSGSRLVTISRYLPTLATFNVGVVPPIGAALRVNTLTSTMIGNIVYVTGDISTTVLTSSRIYQNLTLDFTGATSNDRIRSIITQPNIYPVSNNIASMVINNERVPILDMRSGLGKYEIITSVSDTTLGIVPFDFWGRTYSVAQQHDPITGRMRRPFNYYPQITYVQLSANGNTVSDEGKLNWPTTVYRRRTRAKRAEFNRQRRKTVLGF